MNFSFSLLNFKSFLSADLFEKKPLTFLPTLLMETFSNLRESPETRNSPTLLPPNEFWLITFKLFNEFWLNKLTFDLQPAEEKLLATNLEPLNWFSLKKIDKNIQLKVHFKIKNTEYQNVLLKTKLPRYEVKISLSFKHLNENIGLIKT